MTLGVYGATLMPVTTHAADGMRTPAGVWDGEPRVLTERLPADEGDPSAGTQRRAEVRERRCGIGEEHDAEPRVEDVELAAGETVGLRVGVLDEDVPEAGVPRRLGGARDHPGGDVDAEDATFGPDPPRELERRVAAAAADVEHALARGDARPIHRAATERLELRIEQLLERDPLRTRGLVPVFDLLGVRAGGL